MISSKATLAEWASGSFARCRFGFSDFLPGSGTLPSLPALLGFWSPGVAPSGATSATRYDSFERIFCAARIVAELELADIQRQIGFAGLVKRADNASLQQRREAFDILRMHCPDDILSFGVADDRVRVSRRKTTIADPFICHQQSHLFGDSFSSERLQCRAIDAIDNLSNDLASAADRADDWFLARTDATRSGALEALANVTVLGEAADEGFVNLYLAEQHLPLVAVPHTNTDAVAHIPCRLVGASPDHPVDLVGTHALLGVVHQKRDLKPLDERVFGVLEDRSGDHRKPIAILVAGFAEPVERTALDGPYLCISAARAMDTIRPATRDEIRFAVVFGLEPGEEIGEFHHEEEYGMPRLWCQVPDTRPN